VGENRDERQAGADDADVEGHRLEAIPDDEVVGHALIGDGREDTSSEE
jgi:hypothetical protein